MFVCAGPGKTLGDRLAQEKIKDALHVGTEYSPPAPASNNGRCGMFCKVYVMISNVMQLLTRHPRATLAKHEKELLYLKERLEKLLDEPATEHNWLDFAETWIELIELRSVMQVERGQSIVDCICLDEAVLSALGMANHFRSINGSPPSEVLRRLKQGPGGHLRAHAYEYRLKLDTELAKIARIKEMQLRALGFLSTVIVGAMVGLFNFLSNVVFKEFYGS